MTALINLVKDKPWHRLQAGWTHVDLFGRELFTVCGVLIERCFTPQWGSNWLAADIGLQFVLDIMGLKSGHVLHLPARSMDFWSFADYFLALDFPGFKVVLHGAAALKRSRRTNWLRWGLSRDKWLDLVFDEGCASRRVHIHLLCRSCVHCRFSQVLRRHIPLLEAISELSAALEGCIIGQWDVFRLAALGHVAWQALIVIPV